MKIAAYQFPVTGCIENNLSAVRKAVIHAAAQSVQLLVFPECALTGYPPHDMSSAASVDFDQLGVAHEELQNMADRYEMHLFVGSIEKTEIGCTNSALLFSPGKMCSSMTKELYGDGIKRTSFLETTRVCLT